MKDKVMIIGGGPAGIATAIQLKRYHIDCQLFEQNELGGMIRNAHLIENYPGFPEGITGNDFKKLIKTQCRQNSITPIFERVESLDFSYQKNKFLIKTFSHQYLAKVVVVASGTKPKKLPVLEQSPIFLKRKIYHEIHPLRNEKNKKMVIIGAGDIGFDYALNISAHNEVIILNRSHHIKALPLLQNRIKKKPNILYHSNTILTGIEKGAGKSLCLSLKTNGSTTEIEADFLICALGREPQKDFYTPRIKKDEKQFISRGLLYLVGDLIKINLRQMAIAVGSGIEAAMKIYQNSVELS